MIKVVEKVIFYNKKVFKKYFIVVQSSSSSSSSSFCLFLKFDFFCDTLRKLLIVELFKLRFKRVSVFVIFVLIRGLLFSVSLDEESE